MIIDTPIEGFAIETMDGLIFTVKGSWHPQDRFYAFLRYLPDPAGNRNRSGFRYSRVYHFEEQHAILSQRFPDYLQLDSQLGQVIQSVPRDQIRQIYNPIAALNLLRERGATNSQEEIVLDLVKELNKGSDLHNNLGITGSLMLGLSLPSSDIDLIVYGETAGKTVYNILRGLMAQPGSTVRRPNEKELRTLFREHSQDTTLPYNIFRQHQIRKVNEGRFRDQEFFVRFVKLPHEQAMNRQSVCYQPLGNISVQALVTNDSNAIYTPCRYTIEKVTALDTGLEALPGQIVSFRGRFCEQVRRGEKIRARGQLEKVIIAGENDQYQLVIGGNKKDYLYTEHFKEDA